MSDAFENKIREKLSEADIPFDAKAWKKMERKLNALNDDPRSGFAWWWLAGLLLFLGIGGLVWWHYASKPAEQPVQQEAAKTVPQRQSSPASTDESSPSSGKKPAAATPVQEQPDVTGTDATRKPASEAAAHNAGQPPAKSGIHIDGGPPRKPAHPSSLTTGQPLTAADDKTQAIASPFLQSLPVLSLDNPVVQTKLTGAASNHITPPASEEKTGSEESTKEKKDKLPRRKGFAIGLTMGPDYNAAPSLKYNRVGWNAGVLVHYHLNNRWFLTTGVIFDKKPYGATKKDYNGKPPDDLPYPSYIKKVDATCDILDVPLNVTYNFLDKPKYILGATAGVSTYFMVKEKYQYYGNYGSMGKPYTYYNDNQHYLSVLNLGLTYQRPLNKRMTLGVQPYAKIPLGEIGYGKVRLYSAGLSLQLNFNTRRRID